MTEWDLVGAHSFRALGVKVLTANSLAPGEVVYWNTAAGWRSELQQAEVFDDAGAERALAAAAEWVAACEIVAPYLFPVRVENGLIVPVSAREKIRAQGPSVRPDIGKQAA